MPPHFQPHPFAWNQPTTPLQFSVLIRKSIPVVRPALRWVPRLITVITACFSDQWVNLIKRLLCRSAFITTTNRPTDRPLVGPHGKGKGPRGDQASIYI